MERIAKFLLSKRLLVAGLIISILLISAGLLTRLRFMHGMEDFYDREHPQQAVLDQITERFVGDRWIFVSYEVDDVFSADALAMSRDLSQRIRDLGDGAVKDVVSLATLEDAYGGEMTFRSAPLLPEEIPTDAAALEAIRRRAERNPVIRDNFISEDHRVAAIAVRLAERTELDDDRRKTFVDDLRASLAGVSSQPGGPSFHLTGLPIIETDIPHVALRDTLMGGGLMFLLVSGVILVALRRWRGLGLIVAVVSAASLVGLAMIPATGATYNPISSLLLPILAALCVATTMHFVVESGAELQRDPGSDPRVHTMAQVLKPSMFTIVTTAIGFASLGLSETQSVSNFGWATSAAVLVSGVLTMLIIALAWSTRPASDFVSVKGAAVSRGFDKVLDRFASIVLRRRYVLAAGTVALVAVCAYGATKIRAGESNLHYFDHGTAVRDDATFMEKHLGGTNSFTVAIRAPEEGGFLDPTALQNVARMGEFLLTEGGANRVISIADFLPIMHGAFFGERRSEYRLPDTAQQNAQLLLMNTNDRVSEYIDAERQWVRIYARTPVHNTGKLEVYFNRVEAELAALFPAAQGYSTFVTGDSRIFGLNFSYVSRTQVTSLVVCAIVIVLLMTFMFRSLTVGLFSLLPNALPILLIIGVMGWLGLELSLSTAMIGAVTLGIAVDDTIHFIDAYRKRLAAHGDIDRAVRETFRLKGAPIIWSSAIFTLGFIVFLVADFTPFHLFAALSSLAMVTAIVGDLVVLPVLILVTRARLGVPVKDAEPRGREALLESGSTPAYADVSASR